MGVVTFQACLHGKAGETVLVDAECGHFGFIELVHQHQRLKAAVAFEAFAEGIQLF